MDNISLNGTRETVRRLMANIQKVIVGKQEAIQLVVMALMCRGHVLIEGGPGIGKTTLARSLAHSISGSFKRIQCTSDLLPSDITGTYVFDQRDADFHFRPGPVIANLVLVDEINRASPRTQSAFLEAMEELQVTVDGITHRLPSPFLLIATRNPLHHGGTFPLPETELDRFQLRVHLGYPSHEEETAMVERHVSGSPLDTLEQVVGLEDMLAVQEVVRQVYVDPVLGDYVVTIVNATRHHPAIYMGASPRSSLAITRLAQARAFLDDRDFATPDDVKSVAVPALGHRIILVPSGESKVTEVSVIDEILASLSVDESRLATSSSRPTPEEQESS